MKKIILIILMSGFGWIGWAIGERFGFMTAYFLGCIGSGLGLYAGIRLDKHISG
ncbi:MAG: hypothetical protein GXP53_00530 [Deltaproteobacteria bacterium]|nr:hypothetical protein [Deltaproteobacteria bacterium]